jgi:hypothetical protein
MDYNLIYKCRCNNILYDNIILYTNHLHSTEHEIWEYTNKLIMLDGELTMKKQKKKLLKKKMKKLDNKIILLNSIIDSFENIFLL